MANLNGFNANEVDPNVPFEVRPAGEYIAHMVASETKENSKKTGTFLLCEFEVIEGPHKGAKFWDRLNLSNPSPQAVSIARGSLSAICRAVGVMKPKDSTELHNLPLVLIVKLKKRDDNGEDTNEIKGYKKKPSSLEKTREQPVNGSQQTEQTDVAQGDEKPPWEK